MPLSPKPLSQWTQEDVEALIEEPAAVESHRLDFKREYGLLGPQADKVRKSRRDLLVDICALVNGGGGAILVGVEERDVSGRPTAAGIPGVTDTHRLIEAIDNLVSTHLDIRPTPLRYNPVTLKDQKEILIIEAESNLQSLSMVTLDSSNQFWIRRGTTNRLMTTDEIEYRIQALARIRTEAIDHLAKIRDLADTNPHRPVVRFAAVPLSRHRDGLPVSVSTAASTLRHLSYFNEFPDRRGLGFTPADCIQLLAPSMLGIGIGAQFGNDVRLELRRDGTVVFEFPLRPQQARAVDRSSTAAYVPVSHIYEPILSALYLFRDVQLRFPIGSAAVIQSGVLGFNGMGVGSAMRNWTFQPPVSSGDIDLTPIHVGVDWEIDVVFGAMAQELANALGQEAAIQSPPWVE